MKSPHDDKDKKEPGEKDKPKDKEKEGKQMALAADQKTGFIVRTRMLSRKWADLIHETTALADEYVDLGLGGAEGIQDADFTGSNAGLVKSQFIGAVNSMGIVAEFAKTGQHTDVILQMAMPKSS